MSKPKTAQRGMALIFLAITLFLVVAAAAFGVDMAYVYVQKNRLQNAADAAAMAGATTIYRSVEFKYTEFPGGTYPNPANSTYFPNIDGKLTWTDIARNRVRESLSANQSLDYLRTNADIYVNWYNAITGNPGDLKVPAVRVNLVAPTPLFFAKILGFSTLDITVKATAIATFPTRVDSGLPFALASCSVSSGWDTAKREPKLVNGAPIQFKFGWNTDINADQCADKKASALWTNFHETNAPNSNDMAAFIPPATASTALISDPPKKIQVRDAAFDTLYLAINDCLKSKTCNFSVMPVVNSPSGSGLISTTSTTPYTITHFICTAILGTQKTNEKYVQGSFSTGCRVPSSGSGTSEFSGVIASPNLVE